MELYRLSIEEFLDAISYDLKNKLTEEDIFGDDIHIHHLKRVDSIFSKGLGYYTNPAPPIASRDASIFFRKKDFHTELNIGAKKIVNHFEELQTRLSAIAKLADLETSRVFPKYSLRNSPLKVAVEVRARLDFKFRKDKKDYLKDIIRALSEYNIFVFEFVETWNKKETANIDGVFLQPSTIVLKRQQDSFRREIFTLAHELGHYLLNEEEIEAIEAIYAPHDSLSPTEKWCNNFAYFFLAGNYAARIDGLSFANASNDYHHDVIEEVSQKTHLSTLALYTRLLIQDKIAYKDYALIKSELKRQADKRKEEERRRKEEEKAQGITKKQGGGPKPIKPPLLLSTIQAAFYEGVLNEYDVCQHLNIKPAHLSRYIQ